MVEIVTSLEKLKFLTSTALIWINANKMIISHWIIKLSFSVMLAQTISSTFMDHAILPRKLYM